MSITELVNNQSDIGKEIERQYENFKKANKLRKEKPSYGKGCYNALSELWDEFEENHKTLEKIIPEEKRKDHTYFSNNFFTQVKIVRDKYLTKMQEIYMMQPDKPEVVDDKPELTKVSSLIRLQKIAVKQLKLTLEKINSALLETPTEDFARVMLEVIASQWAAFSKRHDSICLEADDNQLETYNFDTFIDLEDSIQKATINLHHVIRENTQNHKSINEGAQGVNLPKIEIPKFDGSYIEWQSFHDLFCQMIHETSLGNVQKLWYLKSALTGEAAKMISHISLSNDNYIMAWNTIKARYSNHRLIMTGLLDKLFNLPTIRDDSSADLRSLYDNTNKYLLSIEAMKIDINGWDPLLVYMIIKKLDKTTHSLFEQSLANPREFPKLRNLLKFIEKRSQALELLTNKPGSEGKKRVTSLITKGSCPLCNKPHALFACERLLKMSPKARFSEVKKLRLCINCLKSDHTSVAECSLRGCTQCGKKHNTLLHFEQPSKNATTNSRSPRSILASTSELQEHQVASGIVHSNNASLAASSRGSYVFLATTMVKVKNSSGNFITCKAILDSGSQLNLITTSLANKLALETTKHSLNITGIGNNTSRAGKRTNLVIASTNTGFTANIEGYVIDQITNNQPSSSIDISKWNIPKNIKLADPTFHQSSKIDLLIGAELYSSLMSIGQIRINKNLPTLQNTVFGWVIIGKTTARDSDQAFCGIGREDDELNEQVSRFWEMEEVQTETKLLTEEEESCEEIFKNSTTRDFEGRYVVQLPLKMDPITLGNSGSMAIQRFRSLEARFRKNTELKEAYAAFINEYENLGHMEEIRYNDIKQRRYFLPHHCVLKPDSLTTKLRVVFDASAKTSNNISLNDILLGGPAVQDELFSILLRFRQHPHAMTADIAKMYRQFLVTENDSHLQIIIWRESEDHPFKFYRLKTVTYGTKSAAYLATRCLKQLAEDEGATFPLAAAVTLKDFYVDDFMSSFKTLNEALNTQVELTQMMQRGGLQLRKWCSNHKALLQNIKKEERGINLNIPTDKGQFTKTLGLIWHPQADVFFIKSIWPPPKRFTKRSILADISQLFDPLGFVNPVIVIGKIFLQELWDMKLDWDAALPQEAYSRWLEFRNQLPELAKLSLPRQVLVSDPVSIQLHGFSDASERAYGACIYLRSEDCTGRIISRLLCAKSRVAPRKNLSIARLELCAAKLLVQLIKKVQRALTITIDEICCWTDSTIVLSWIASPSSNMNTFVANRVASIQRSTTANQWKHIAGDNNPADILSRGLLPEQILRSHLWFNGPTFFQSNERNWPIQPTIVQNWSEERRRQKTILTTSENPSIIEQINSYNKFRRLQRVVAFMLRFISNCRKEKPKRITSKHPTPEELEDALENIVKHIQRQAFPSELNNLSKGKPVTNTSPLAAFTPYIKDGIIRVGGRLQMSRLPFNAQHQILLPHSNAIVVLLVKQYHEDRLHIGQMALLAALREKFWILRANEVTKSVCKNCRRCFMARPSGISQLMGNLPAERVQPSKPFTNVGIDFCGPFQIHYSIRGKRPTKAYIAVFICLSTKCIHLEIVSDLTTAAFINALKRFSSRRGLPAKIFSDNATNFKGAQSCLRELHVLLKDENNEIEKYATEKSIKWINIPARSPHVGGLWEAAVKSLKYHLKRAVDDNSLTYEQLLTVVVEIEGILNSRPLTPMSSSPDDLRALSPNNFLGLEPTGGYTARPPGEGLLSQWKHLNSIIQEFWERWSKEYLQTLQARTKWTKKSGNIAEGTLVLLKDNLPPRQWQMGRVVKTNVGNDGLVRSVDLKVRSGITSRSIHQICPLPEDCQPITPPDSPSSSSNERKLARTPQQPVALCTTHQPKSSNLPKIRKRSSNRAENSQSRKKAATGIMGLLALNLISTSLALISSSSLVQITPFKHNPGMYFEEAGAVNLVQGHWNILVYLNLSSYFAELEGFKSIHNDMTNICKRSDNFVIYCQSTIVEIKHKIEELGRINDLIHHHHPRPKRAPLEIIGSIQHSLFGVLDKEYANYIEGEIKKLADNENHLLELAKRQESMIESTQNIFRKTTSQIQSQFESLRGHVQEAVQIEIFTALAGYALILMNNYERTQTEILNILTESYTGKPSTQLLSPNQLRQQIYFIREQLPATLTLPVQGEDLLAIYKLMTAKGRVLKDKIVFKLQIPLINAETFTLMHLYPLPTQVGSNFLFLQPSSEYLAINLHRDALFPLTAATLNKCHKLTSHNFICAQTHPVYSKESSIAQCEISLLNDKDPDLSLCKVMATSPSQYWIQLGTPGQWIFSVKTTSIINVVCKTQRERRELSGSGIINLAPGCIIRHRTMTIKAPSNLETSSNSTITISSNLTAMMSKHPQIQPHDSSPNFLSEFDTQGIREDKMLLNMGLNQHTSFETYHHIHHYISVYVIIAAIILISMYIYRRNKFTLRSIELPLDTLRRGEDVQAEHISAAAV